MKKILCNLLLMGCSLSLTAGSPPSVQVAFGQWVRNGDPMTIMLAAGKTEVQTIDVELTVGGVTKNATVQIDYEPYQIGVITLPVTVEGETHTLQPYSLKIHCDEGDAEVQGMMGFVDNDWHRNLLVEEGTGTWCGNCPRGIVAMKLLREKYPDTFVGMTLHYGSGSHKEVMNYYEYGRFLIDNQYITVFPSSTLNRQLYDADPYNEVLPWYYDLALLEATPARFELKGEYLNDYASVRLTATTEFDVFDATHEYRIAFACIENDVHQPGDDRYDQFNNYGNNAYGEFYGFEDYPSWIPSDSMWYQEVVRYINDMNGTPGSLPEVLELNQEYSFSADINIPENVLNGENVCFVGMLIDATTQQILNCAEISAAEVVRGNEVPLFYDGFRYGLFGHDYVRYDVDGNTPFSSMGLEVGEAWGISEEEGDYYAFSTSYYSPSGMSDDWLITPQVFIGEIGKLTLTWRARSSSAKYRDGYEVLVSTQGADRDCFSLVEQVSQEEAEWTTHSVTVDVDGSDSLRVAFRNTTKNGEKLYVDDIRIENADFNAIEEKDVPVSDSKSVDFAVYDLSGRRLTNLQTQKGLVIVRTADGRTVKRIIR